MILDYSCYHCYYYHIISSYLHNPSAPEHVVQLQLVLLDYFILSYITSCISYLYIYF